VRRSRLYYLRGLTGKKARLRSKVRDLSGLISAEEAEAGTAGAAVVAEAAEPEAATEAPAEPVAEPAAAEEEAKKDGE
jgi:hypothetical protein